METVHPLRSWRQENGATLAALAKDAGVVPSHLSQIETRDRVPSLELASRLSGLTKLPITAFVPSLASAPAPLPGPASAP